MDAIIPVENGALSSLEASRRPKHGGKAGFYGPGSGSLRSSPSHCSSSVSRRPSSGCSRTWPSSRRSPTGISRLYLLPRAAAAIAAAESSPRSRTTFQFSLTALIQPICGSERSFALLLDHRCCSQGPAERRCQPPYSTLAGADLHCRDRSMEFAPLLSDPRWPLLFHHLLYLPYPSHVKRVPHHLCTPHSQHEML